MTTAMNILLVALGLGLSALGGYGIIHPQKVVDVGTGSRFKDSELSERGRLVQRGKGMLVVVLGIMTIFTGLLV